MKTKSGTSRTIVRSSAQGAAPDAGIASGRMHDAVAKAAEDSGIPFTVLRPAKFVQKKTNFATPETIRGQSAFYSPLGETKVSATDTRIISAVAARVLVDAGHEGKRYDLTGGESPWGTIE